MAEHAFESWERSIDDKACVELDMMHGALIQVSQARSGQAWLYYAPTTGIAFATIRATVFNMLPIGPDFI